MENKAHEVQTTSAKPEISQGAVTVKINQYYTNDVEMPELRTPHGSQDISENLRAIKGKDLVLELPDGTTKVYSNRDLERKSEELLAKANAQAIAANKRSLGSGNLVQHEDRDEQIQRTKFLLMQTIATRAILDNPVELNDPSLDGFITRVNSPKHGGIGGIISAALGGGR